MKPKGPTPPARRVVAQPAAVEWPVPAATNYDLPVIQLAGERERLVVTGRRTDDADCCELLVVHDAGGSFALYPHGAAQLGVRLSQETAATVARFLADGHRDG